MLTVFHTSFVSSLTDGEFYSYLSVLPQKEQVRILQFKRCEDRQVHLACRLLLLRGLIEHGLPQNCLEFLETTPTGKPYITHDIEFSLSNSGRCAVCAFSNKGQIGVDIEMVKDLNIFDFKVLMNLNEWYDLLKAEDRQLAFFTFWTKKEAVLKADGIGLGIPLDKVLLEKKHALLSEKKWFTKKIHLESQYICHIATSQEDRNIVLKKIKPGDLWI